MLLALVKLCCKPSQNDIACTPKIAFHTLLTVLHTLLHVKKTYIYIYIYVSFIHFNEILLHNIILGRTSEDALQIYTCQYSSTTWVNGSRELQFNYNECNLIFLKSKTVITHMKRRRSDLHPFPSNWVNASRELQFNCNKCNFIFAKLNTFNTHMKKQHYVALGRHRFTLLGKLY